MTSLATPSPPPSPWQLTGRTALVTGGSRGIGRAIVDELVALGAFVIAVARNQPDLDDLARAYPDRVHTVAADITVAADRARIVAAARERGALHVLVHNAGGNVRSPLVGYDDETVEQLIELNLTAPVLLSRDLHASLRAAACDGEAGASGPMTGRATPPRGAAGASVIHVGSIAGSIALPTGVAYAAAKAGLAQAARTLALEWARDGIRVNTVAPWYTRTPLVEPVLSQPERMAAIVARTPLGRIAEPREVATVVAFLALPAAGYVTGQCIAVDGGMSIQGLAVP